MKRLQDSRSAEKAAVVGNGEPAPSGLLPEAPRRDVTEHPKTLIELISRAVLDDRIDVDKMRALFELQKDIQAEERKVIFVSAMARLQAKIPQMLKLGVAKNSLFVRFEDMVGTMRPLLEEFGFSVSFDEESHSDKTSTFAMRVSHEDGHSETRRLTVSIDAAARNSQGNSIRPAIQDNGSTVSYARRYLYKMHFDIVEKGEDTNGENPEKISTDEALDLTTQIQDVGGNLASMLKHFKIEAIAQLRKTDLKEALQMIASKRGSK